MATYRNTTDETIDLTSGRRVKGGATFTLDVLPPHEGNLSDAGIIELVSGSVPPAPINPGYVLGIGAPALDLRGATAGQAIDASTGQPIDVATLVGGKVQPGQLPSLAINDVFSVASQSAMLTLTAEVGDVAIRSDQSKSYMLAASPASTLANWKELKSTDYSSAIAAKADQAALDAEVAARTALAGSVAFTADLDTDPSMAANSDTKFPSQKATKTALGLKVAKTQLNVPSTDKHVPRWDQANQRLNWRKADRYNVEDFGAVGDNSTNNTAAIQSAIDAADAAGGGVVFFPKGTYKTGKLTCASNVYFAGVSYDIAYTARGSRLSLISGTNDDMFFVPWGVRNVCFDDLHLEGNYANQSGTSRGIAFAEDPANTGPQSYQQAHIRRCSVKGFLTAGIYVGKWNEGVDTVQSFVANNAGHGIWIETSDCQVSQNHILANGGDGVRLGNSSCVVSNNSSISGNLRGVAVVSGGAGASYSSGTAISQHQIIGNHLDFNLRQGVYVQGNHTSVVGNLIATNGAEANNTYANVEFAGQLTDSSWTIGNVLSNNVFGPMRPGQTNKPSYHINVSPLSGANLVPIREANNTFDMSGCFQSTPTNDWSFVQASAAGRLVGGHLVISHPGSPTVAAGAAAGTSPPSPAVTGNDGRGQLFSGTGTSPATGVLATMTFNKPYRDAAPTVVLTPGNAATAALQAYVSTTTTGFSINLAAAAAASQSGSTYQWFYSVIG
ncbi:MAG: glycosyl hydrolase family 28-related protein [Patulibacter minatonensis]